MSSVTGANSMVEIVFWIGITTPLSCSTAVRSSAGESPFLGAELLRGNTTRFALYAFRRFTLAWRLSRLRFLRRWSTEMPMVGATLEAIPASCSQPVLPRVSVLVHRRSAGNSCGKHETLLAHSSTGGTFRCISAPQAAIYTTTKCPKINPRYHASERMQSVAAITVGTVLSATGLL